ncbi:MAG: enoyl-CoA hydratase [Polyangiaceae bacterium]|nr:enoyl-CoA hydratase [Polyangiaceae bacterium]NUQ75341.1 enoyl-CoA hydratase [Polyangiaceae bacterium]
MSEEVLIVERDGAVATVTMNRPQARNALNRQLHTELGATLQKLADDASVRVIVLTGAGGAFCAGADLRSGIAENPGGLTGIEVVIDQYHAMIRAIVSAPKPVIAMVDGCAVGFGCDLALACDMRIISSDAYFQEKFVKIGLMPDGGGTFWLPRLIGLGRAMEYIMTGEPINAETAHQLGLANRVVPSEEIRRETMALAGVLAKGPPVAFGEIKKAMRASLGGTIDTALEMERAGQIRCLHSSDCMEGVSAWIQKREPAFTGK